MRRVVKARTLTPMTRKPKVSTSLQQALTRLTNVDGQPPVKKQKTAETSGEKVPNGDKADKVDKAEDAKEAAPKESAKAGAAAEPEKESAAAGGDE